MTADKIRQALEAAKDHAKNLIKWQEDGGNLAKCDKHIIVLYEALAALQTDAGKEYTPLEQHEAYMWFLSLAGSEYQYTPAGRRAYKIVKATLEQPPNSIATPPQDVASTKEDFDATKGTTFDINET